MAESAPRERVLVVDDEANLRYMLRRCLEGEGYAVEEAADGLAGLSAVESGGFDYILCDVRMPRLDGVSFLKAARERGVETPVIMLSAYGTAVSALEAIEAGAFDYVFKPFHPEEILLRLRRAGERERLRRENESLKEAALQAGRHGIVARSRAMREVLGFITQVSSVGSAVLITGESGTGKELVALAIHNGGARASGPFVAVNCGAIPEQLLESELFGHVRGAFTDAVRDRVGLYEAAEGGTLFLDEVGELPLSLQVKLLRVLQEGEVRRVGDTQSRAVDVRVVAATGRGLEEEVSAGRFREDLYYRLNVLPLHLPPLRERKEDIPLLVEHFLIVHCARLGRERPEMSPEVMEALLGYGWPGNVRELENLVERMLVLSRQGRLSLEDVPVHIRLGRPAPAGEAGRDLDLRRWVQDLEARLIREALAVCHGNRSEAARRLKISYPTLLSKIKGYGLEEEGV
jgi:two-component system response regulator AtoC